MAASIQTPTATKPRKPRYSLVMVAYHEAAHAVVSHVLGMPAASLRIEVGLRKQMKPGDLAGRYQHEVGWLIQHLHDAGVRENRLLVGLASTQAERRLIAERGWRVRMSGEMFYSPDGHASDWIEIVDRMIAALPPGSKHLSSEALESLRLAEERAGALVDAHWAAVEALAAALLDTCYVQDKWGLGGLEIHRLISEALGETEPSPGEQFLMQQEEHFRRARQAYDSDRPELQQGGD